jgi:hypothetical protein
MFTREEISAAFINLIHASHRLHPDDLPRVVRDEANRIGLDDLTILLADLEQRILIPFAPDAGSDVPPPPLVSIDGSMAGRAYRTERPLVGDRVDGRTPLWLPLLDSSERIGVVAVSTTIDVDDQVVASALAFASLIGELIASKAQYGDAITRTRRTRDVTLSAELRWSMLPPLTFSGRNVTITGVLEPAYTIAGDTFDYAVDGEVANVAIIDAVGHGLEASRIANLAVTAYRHGRRRGLSTLDIYKEMDEAIADQFGGEKFATAQLATLDLAEGQLCWLNAGHPSPMVIRQLRRIDLQSETCLPVGVAFPGSRAELARFDLEPGDLLLFFTDGVIEARSPDGEEFGRDRLGDLLAQAATASQTPAETVRRLAHAVLEHQEGILQDDGTLLLVVWHGPPAALR